MREITGKSLGLKTVRGRLLTVKEIALFLRVSERWVQKKMKEKQFPIKQLSIGPENIRVDSIDLEEWLRKTVIEAGRAPLPLKAVRKIKKEEVSV